MRGSSPSLGHDVHRYLPSLQRKVGKGGKTSEKRKKEDGGTGSLGGTLRAAN